MLDIDDSRGMAVLLAVGSLAVVQLQKAFKTPVESQADVPFPMPVVPLMGHRLGNVYTLI